MEVESRLIERIGPRVPGVPPFRQAKVTGHLYTNYFTPISRPPLLSVHSYEIYIILY